MLLLNSIAGGIAHLAWCFIRTYLDRRDNIKSVYPLLKIVLFFYIVPIAFITLIFSKVDFRYGISITGYLFFMTPMMLKVVQVLAVLWFVGMMWNLGIYSFDYLKLRRVMVGNIRVVDNEMKLVLEKLTKELGIKEKVTFLQNYSLTSPIVTGAFRKRIVLPMRKYENRELEVVLYHELTHIKNHDLFVKKIGMFLRIIIWFNPLIYILLKHLEEWSETNCDLTVCYQMENPVHMKEYFEYVLKGLHDNFMITTRIVMQLQITNELSLKRRILRMREYKREKELKRAVVVPLTLVFSLLCVSTALAAGNRAADIYESIYVETDNAVKNEEFNTSVQNYLEEHTQEPGLDDGIEIIDLEGEIAPRASYNINWKVPSSSRTQSASFTKSSGTIYVAANLSRSGRIGIIEPSGAMRYVTGSGEVSHTFVVYQSGLHRVFVENTSSSSSLTAIGHYTN